MNQFGKVSEVKLRAAPGSGGRTVLTDVSFTAPYKIMKPFEKPDGSIQVMPLCASAGIMKGDVQEFDYQVDSGASLEILSQSFEKIHRMEGGSAARRVQVRVAENACLSYFPQPVIPFAGSAFDSRMEIHLEDASSRLFLMDILSCGRAACGERFAYRRFASRVEIRRSGELIYRDNTRYEPEQMPMEGMGLYEGFSHMANIFLTVQDAKSGSVLLDEIRTLLQDAANGCEGGVTRLASGDLAVRILGNRAQPLQELAEAIKKFWEKLK